MTVDEGSLDDESRLLFGAGFVFGVMFTMLVLGIVMATVVGGDLGPLVASEAFVVLGAGIVFAAIVGASLYLLAFPDNRLKVPIDTEAGALGPAAAMEGEDAGDGDGGAGDREG